MKKQILAAIVASIFLISSSVSAEEKAKISGYEANKRTSKFRFEIEDLANKLAGGQAGSPKPIAEKEEEKIIKRLNQIAEEQQISYPYIVQIDHYELLGLGLTDGKEKEDRRVLSNTNYNKAMMALQSCVVMDVKQCPKPVRLVEAYIRAADFPNAAKYGKYMIDAGDGETTSLMGILLGEMASSSEEKKQGDDLIIKSIPMYLREFDFKAANSMWATIMNKRDPKWEDKLFYSPQTNAKITDAQFKILEAKGDYASYMKIGDALLTINRKKASSYFDKANDEYRRANGGVNDIKALLAMAEIQRLGEQQPFRPSLRNAAYYAERAATNSNNKTLGKQYYDYFYGWWDK